ncbi:MAG TPA: hypothetical protein VFC71_02410 [Candidatus Polarisedimenticolia bacterium]|nr:hypothetical protein [Candidatus Polarisedimenticolia bacterium]
MEARIVQLASRREVAVRAEADRIVVEGLVVNDPSLAAWLSEQPADDHEILVERAIRIGLTAIQSVGVTMNVDAVRTEFERLAETQRAMTEHAAEALEQTLRSNFGDVDGRLPRTLEAFLGDRGKLQATVRELFDPARKDSALGRLGSMLEDYFDGDASRLATLLDPMRVGSPLNGFRAEVAAGFKAIEEKLVAFQASQSARADERSKSSAKGVDYEDLVEGLLGAIARGGGDLLERTGNEAGSTLKSKKGDFVLTLNPGLTRGADVRMVVEVKDRAISIPAMRAELRDAKANRDASVGLVVFTPAHAPAGIAPFDVRGDDVWCVLDPEDIEPSMFEAAVRMARYIALASLAARDTEIDTSTISQALTCIREQLEQIRNLKSQLTSIGNATKAVWTGLDGLQAGVVEQVTRAEAAIRNSA